MPICSRIGNTFYPVAGDNIWELFPSATHYCAFCYSYEVVHVYYHKFPPFDARDDRLAHDCLAMGILGKRTVRKIKSHVPRGVTQFSKLLPLDAKESRKLISDPRNYRFNILTLVISVYLTTPRYNCAAQKK